MIDPAVLRAASVAVAVGWLPLLVRFVTAWITKGHPINLAVTGLVGFAAYVPPYLAFTAKPNWPIATITAIDVLTLGLCTFLVRRARRRRAQTVDH